MAGGSPHPTDPPCLTSVPRPDRHPETSLRHLVLECVLLRTAQQGRHNRDKLTGDWPARAEEKCFALNAATIIDRAVELEAVGGTYANTRPTEFICLVLKLLQLQPEREIVLEYLRAEEFK